MSNEMSTKKKIDKKKDFELKYESEEGEPYTHVLRRSI